MNKLKNVLLGLSVIAVMAGWPAGVAAAKQASSPKVEYYPHQQVAAAFAKGTTLTQGRSGHAIYQVMTARRDRPGEVEVHKLDTDIYYVVKGTATFVMQSTRRRMRPGASRFRVARHIILARRTSSSSLTVCPTGLRPCSLPFTIWSSKFDSFSDRFGKSWISEAGRIGEPFGSILTGPCGRLPVTVLSAGRAEVPLTRRYRAGAVCLPFRKRSRKACEAHAGNNLIASKSAIHR